MTHKNMPLLLLGSAMGVDNGDKGVKHAHLAPCMYQPLSFFSTLPLTSYIHTQAPAVQIKSPLDPVLLLLSFSCPMTYMP